MALDTYTAGPAPYAFEEAWGYAYDPEISTLGVSDYSRRLARARKEATGGIEFWWSECRPPVAETPEEAADRQRVIGYLAGPALSAGSAVDQNRRAA